MISDEGRKLLHSVPSACDQLGVGKTTLYKMIAEGHLRIVKIGRITRITDESLREVAENGV